MKFGYGVKDGALIAQFVPGKPGETDCFNELWSRIREGAVVKIRFEDFETGVPQLKLIVSNLEEDDDDEDDD